MNFTMNIPGLKDVIIKKMEEVEDYVAIHVEMEVRPHSCPSCGMKTRNIHDYRLQKVTHLKCFERRTVLFYRKRRYVCADCGKRFYEQNPFVERYQRFSIEWNQAVRIRSVKGRTFKEVAEHYGSSSSTIIRRFDRLAEEEVIEVTELPRVIAIDEYKGDTQAGKYQLIIADGETREPIDILPNRRKKTLKHYLRRYGGKVEVVIMDMSPSFKAAVCEALGKPVIVADRFHFCRYIYFALDGVRRRVQKEWHGFDRKGCKRMRHVFYKANEKLTEENRWYLKRYLSLSDELRRAYVLKEAYRKWFNEAKKRGMEGILQTKKELLAFYKQVEVEGIPEFTRAIQTFKNWQTEILNSFVYNYSNGFLEGINNLTKVIKRHAYGFRNFIRSKAKILLTHKYKEIGNHVG